MYFRPQIVLIAGVLAAAESSGVVPAVAAPLVAPAHVGYAHGVPQNIPPYASQVSVVNRAVSPYIAGPAPYAAPVAAPFAPAPYVAGPAPVIPAPYAAGYPAPYAAGFAAPYAYSPYAAPSPFLRTAFGYAPTFVR